MWQTVTQWFAPPLYPPQSAQLPTAVQQTLIGLFFFWRILEYCQKRRCYPVCRGMIGESQRICNKTVTVQSTYSRISMFTNFDVRDFDLSWYLILIYLFGLSWMFRTNRDETKWLAGQFPPLPCFCADHSRLSQALSLNNWRWFAFVLYGMRPSFNHSMHFML